MLATLSLLMGVVAALSSLVAVAVAARYIDRCLQHWQGFACQKHTVLISTIIPVYALLSWFCVLFPELSLYVLVLVDTYEVFAIYHFMELMKSYMGGYDGTVRRIRAQPPVRILWFHLQPHDKTLYYIQICVLQFVAVKPLITLVQAGLEHFRLMTQEISLSSPFLYLAALKGISLCVAMVALIAFYRFARPILRVYNIISKFLIIKLVIFLNVIQNFIFGAMAARQVIPPADGMSSAQRTYRFLYFLICVEMAVLAFVFPRVFPADEKMVKHGEGGIEMDQTDTEIALPESATSGGNDSVTTESAMLTDEVQMDDVPLTLRV